MIGFRNLLNGHLTIVRRRCCIYGRIDKKEPFHVEMVRNRSREHHNRYPLALLAKLGHV